MVLHGIDVSGYQPGNIPALVPADFVIVKATGGTGFVNPHLPEQAALAPERVGYYHFAGDGYLWTTPEAEAQHFLSEWTKWADPTDIPILDWETSKEVPAPVWDTAWAARWIDIVAGATGQTPMLYCNLSVAQDYDWSKVQAMGVKLWLAWYGSDARIEGYRYAEDIDWLGTQMNGWRRPAIWQYTQHGILPGYDGELDLNIAYEDVWATNLIPGLEGLRA